LGSRPAAFQQSDSALEFGLTRLPRTKKRNGFVTNLQRLSPRAECERAICYVPSRRLLGEVGLGLLVSLVWLAGGLSAAETSGDPAVSGELYARVKQTAVEVLVDDHLNGSGNMIAAEGLAITAAHVIGRPGVRVELLSAVAGRCKAEVVAVDLGHDLALLRVEPRDGGYPFLPVAEALPPVGGDAYLVGTPIFRHAVMFRGIVARESPTFEHLNPGYVAVLTVAATVPSGTSGGAWVDRQGALIGVQSGVMSNNGTPIGVSFAGLGSAVQRLLETRKTASTPNLGAAVEELWQQGRDILDRFPPRTEGLIVKVLQADGPAARGGLKQFDLIVEMDGQAVRLPEELLRLIRQEKPGESVALSVVGPDGTGKRQVSVTLGRLEIGWPEPAADGKPR
jgi:serine protease Do